jgi:alkanesulfonate monooxygenase SsuD/methylene tetrahydromethanopterin reductase-like flavin-dependent oxidoreductase (luciferase family)
MVSMGILVDNITYDPRSCLERSIEIEKAGFRDLWDGDHLLPWYHTGGHCSNLTVQLTEYLAHTKKIKVGSMVYSPIGIRNQPVDIALIMASMELFHPGRVLCGIGAGEAMNEKAATGLWPPPKERVERMEEAIQVILRCWTAREYFHWQGRYFNTRFYLYDRPELRVPLIVAANGPKMANIAGKYADALIGITSPETFKTKLIPAFENAAKEAGRDPSKLEKWAFVSTSYHPDLAKAFANPRKSCGYLFPDLFEEFNPEKIEREALTRGKDEVLKQVFNISNNIDEIIEGFDRFYEVGIDHIIWDELSWDPTLSPKIYADKIKPYFAEQYKGR